MGLFPRGRPLPFLQGYHKASLSKEPEISSHFSEAFFAALPGSQKPGFQQAGCFSANGTQSAHRCIFKRAKPSRNQRRIPTQPARYGSRRFWSGVFLVERPVQIQVDNGESTGMFGKTVFLNITPASFITDKHSAQHDHQRCQSPPISLAMGNLGDLCNQVWTSDNARNARAAGCHLKEKAARPPK